MASLSIRLADRLLDGGLTDFIHERRADGGTWYEIAFEFSTRTGVMVPSETMRRWADDLEADADALAS